MIIKKQNGFFNEKKKIVIYGYGNWLSYRVGWFKAMDDIVAFSDKNIKKKQKWKELKIII